MKVVLLAGGLGTRMSEKTQYMPKPMVPIGNRPILRHLMSYFASFGYKEFIVCAGYKSEQISEYFSTENYVKNEIPSDWVIDVVDTGAETLTAGRVARIKSHLREGEQFWLTYGDSLSDVNLDALAKYHNEHGKLATMTVTQPRSRFGVVRFQKDPWGIAELVTKFEEKPKGSDWVNSGFLLCDYPVVDYMFDRSSGELRPLDEEPFENKPVQNLVDDQELTVYMHNGFYQPMDTVSEQKVLNSLWNKGEAPWKIWED